MIAFGHEFPLALTVGAMQEITDLCPDGDIKRLGELLNGKTNDALTFEAEFIAALSRGAEQQAAFAAQLRGEHYTPRPLTVEMALALSKAEFMAAVAEAMRTYKGDQAATVETAPAKKNGDAAADTASS